MNWRFINLGLVIVMVMVSVMGLSTTPTVNAQDSAFAPKFEAAICPFELPANIIDGEDILCGYVTVPEFHAITNANVIRIAVAILPSTSDSPAPDPLVMEQGGPGGSTLADFSGFIFDDQFLNLRANRDLILIEQRGTLYSQPNLMCEELASLYTDELDEDLEDVDPSLQGGVGIMLCHNRLVDEEGINLSAFNSVENAADIPMVVTALGYDTFNLYGVSYGTMLAQHVMRDHPDRLRSVILDAVAPLHINYLPEQPASAGRAFEQLFERCEADPICSNLYPDLKEVFFDTVRELNYDPAYVPLIDPATGEQIDEYSVNGYSLISLVFQALYVTDILPDLPGFIYDTASGDTTWIELLYSRMLRQQSFSDGMFYSVLCAEDADFTWSDINRDGVEPFIADTMGTGGFGITCAMWDVEALDNYVDDPVSSDIPTLVMSGEFDPITPPSNGEAVAETLTNAYVYEFPGVGHGAIFSDCAIGMMVEFLDSPHQAPNDTCVTEMDIVFNTRTDLIVPVPVNIDNIATVVPEGWISAGQGLFRRGTALEPTAWLRIAASTETDATTVVNTILENPQLVREKGIGGYEWAIYMDSLEESTRFVAITTIDGVAYRIVFDVLEGDSEALADLVLLPALEAFSVAGE